MAIIKMAAAARRAHAGSVNTIRRALQAAGVPLVVLSPGVYAIEEEDLSRFLASRGVDRPAETPKRPARQKSPKKDRRR